MTEEQFFETAAGAGGAAASVRAALAAALSQLDEVGAHDEALAEYVSSRRVVKLFTKAPALLPLGRVWRLGVFLLARDGSLYATGHTTRAVPPKHPGFQSISAEERRGYRAAAFAGPFGAGETVNFDARRIGLTDAELGASAGPLIVVNGRARVLWNAAASAENAHDFERYLAERIELLQGGGTPA